MTTDVASRPASPAQLDWLGKELTVWRAEGLLGDGQADAIIDRYHAVPDLGRRFSLARLLLSLGAVFVGIGLIWLVAANIDQLPPLTRLGVVAAIWLALLVVGEVLPRREAIPFPVIGAARLLAALAFGAVIFQAAQSLQVPAYEPSLIGLWGLGALVHAYAVRGLGPLLVGVAAGTAWFLWQVLWESPSGLTVVLCLGAAAIIAVSLGAVHERALTRFAAPWRELGTLLGLSALFAAALPFVDSTGFEWNTWLVVGLVVATIAAAAGPALSRGISRFEPLGAVAVLGASVGLVLWEAGADGSQALTLADWAHAGVSVVAYVAVAVAVAALGVLQNSWRLTAIAATALVVFTTFQSFAVFAQIIQGAWLFIVLGLVFLATGYLFDRARRELAANLEGTESKGAGR